MIEIVLCQLDLIGQYWLLIIYSKVLYVVASKSQKHVFAKKKIEWKGLELGVQSFRNSEVNQYLGLWQS